MNLEKSRSRYTKMSKYVPRSDGKRIRELAAETEGAGVAMPRYGYDALGGGGYKRKAYHAY